MNPIVKLYSYLSGDPEFLAGEQLEEYRKGNTMKAYEYRGFYVPERMMAGIERYIHNHIRPGEFLQAVISNDIKTALMYADDENFANIQAYVAFFYNKAPSICHGSREKMEAWIKRGKEGEK